jgi:hypothetical protein
VSLIPEVAGHAEMIEALWLTLTGRGLSPLDAEQLCHWLARGIPGQVIAAALRDTFAARSYDCRPGEPPIRALRQCARAVEREFLHWLRINLGRRST